MLRKTRKLNLAWQENQNFYRQFTRRTGQFFQIYSRKEKTDKRFSRTSVVVGKKVSLLSVQRNKIKRQIYQLLTHLRIWESNQDIVITVRQKATPEKYLQELKQLL